MNTLGRDQYNKKFKIYYMKLKKILVFFLKKNKTVKMGSKHSI